MRRIGPPALLITICTVPNSLFAAAAAAFTDSALVISVTTATTLTPYSLRISSAALSSTSLPRDSSTRFTPSAANPPRHRLTNAPAAAGNRGHTPFEPKFHNGRKTSACPYIMSGMHLVRRAANVVPAPHPAYHNHSHGYQVAPLVDHTSGSVHTGLSMNHLAANGTIAPHLHSYEEGFYILEGQAILGINDAAYHLRPGDFGAFKAGTVHAWRNPGEAPLRWLGMAAPQPEPAGKERDTFFPKNTCPSPPTSSPTPAC